MMGDRYEPCEHCGGRGWRFILNPCPWCRDQPSCDCYTNHEPDNVACPLNRDVEVDPG